MRRASGSPEAAKFSISVSGATGIQSSSGGGWFSFSPRQSPKVQASRTLARLWTASVKSSWSRVMVGSMGLLAYLVIYCVALLSSRTKRISTTCESPVMVLQALDRCPTST